MKVKVEIQETRVNEKRGTSARTGKPYAIREQNGYLHKPDQAYPVALKITLDDDAQAYPPGFYELADESFFVGRFGDLQVRPRLRPVAAEARKAG